MGYSNASKAIIVHVADEDKIIKMLPNSQNGNTVGKTYIINESGLYSLILSSKLPTAKQFKHWVTAEVLPAIRKTGGYIAGEKDMTDEELICKAWFVGKDVAEALGYGNASKTIIIHVADEDKTSVVIPDSGSNYKSKAIIINESGLYSLIFSIYTCSMRSYSAQN